MGREMWTVIQDASGATVWDSAENESNYFCGRNDYTNVIAYCPSRTEDDEVDFTDTEVYNWLKEDLTAQQEKLYREYDRYYDCIHDAKMARQNAQTLDAFLDFTSYIDEYQGELNSTNWSLCSDMLQLMIDTVRRAVELCVASFDDCIAINDKERLEWLRSKGWKVKWIISE